jgi:arylsulfatase A-like enzyme
MGLLVVLLWDAGFALARVRSDDAYAYSGGRASTEAADAPPTIVFFVVDDLGWNDIGYQSSDLSLASPAMTAAASVGVTFARYYTYAECTPARSSLLTGQYASTVGMQHDCITTCDPFGVPSKFALLPAVLKQQQPLYSAAMVGKWDVGHYAPSLWPTQRGFDSSLHLNCYGYVDYHNHLNLGGFQDLHDGFANVKVADALGTTGGLGDDVQREMVDSADSRYSTFVFARRAVSVLASHANDLLAMSAQRRRQRRRATAATPAISSTFTEADKYSFPGLFLYVAWNAVHTTLSLPNGYNATEEYASITAGVDTAANPDRALLAGALKAADDAFAQIVDALKLQGLYGRCVVVVASDNGGSTADGGNNLPLRGGKRTQFEGGVRVPAFLHSPLLPTAARGATLATLVHVSDWLPTLAFGLQGSSSSSAALSGVFDGVDQWAAIRLAGSSGSLSVTAAPRTALECGMDYLEGSVVSNGAGSTVIAATDIKNVAGCLVSVAGEYAFKLLWNQENVGWTEPSGENAPIDFNHTAASSRYGAYLFDVSTDPYETINLLWGLPEDDDGRRHLREAEKGAPVEGEHQVDYTARRATVDVREKRRALQSWSTENSVHTSPSLLEKRALGMLTLLCARYNTMAPAQWKEKLGFPKGIFAENDNFVTYWTTEVDDASDFAGSDGVSIDGPACDPEEMLALIKSDSNFLDESVHGDS